MKPTENNKVVFFHWQADSRYFEPKNRSYYRFLIILGLLLSVLLYFFSEFLLIMLVWVLIFVAYVKALVPPPLIEYKLTKFGLQYFNLSLAYKHISAFTVINKPQKTLLRFFIFLPSSSELFVVLPDDKDQQDQIIEFLKEKTPFLDRVEKTEVEKIAAFLSRLTGF